MAATHDSGNRGLDPGRDGAAVLRVNPPLGGYVVAGVLMVFLALTPFVALEMALTGEPIGGVLMLILGIPMFYLLTKMSLRENREIRRFRRRLRVDHPWLYAIGIVTRLGFIALVGLAGSIDLLYFDASLWPVLQVTVGLLVIGSMLSLGISSTCRAIMSSGS